MSADLLSAAKCAANVLALLAPEVQRLGLRAANVPAQLQAAIEKAEAERWNCIEVTRDRSPFSGWCAMLTSATGAQALDYGPTREAAVSRCIDTAVKAGLIEFEAAHALPVMEVK